MMNSRLVSMVALFVWFLSACSVSKDVVYFQGVDSLTPEQVEQLGQTYSTKIGTDDLLTITVTGWDASVLSPFNPPAYATAPEGSIETTTTKQLQTYLVYKDGTINFPVLGKVKVSGYTKQELAEVLRKEIDQYANGVSVNVQIVNFRVTVLGEVAQPGVMMIKNDRLSLLDALGGVGDLTIAANRKNILVIRDNEGQKEFGRVDLTDPAVFASPYFYLKQNDVVYVEPNKYKQRNARYSVGERYTISIFSSILSAVSVITTLVLAITK